MEIIDKRDGVSVMQRLGFSEHQIIHDPNQVRNPQQLVLGKYLEKRIRDYEITSRKIIVTSVNSRRKEFTFFRYRFSEYSELGFMQDFGLIPHGSYWSSDKWLVPIPD